jgi:hypothetical protein
MKVVFAGPSLPDREFCAGASSVAFRAPAALGDVTKAVVEGATVIGLVDGVFESVAAVWHKEILYALSEGVQVLGAASMGALRAAECAPFGMIGVGTIFAAYASGQLVDDDAVAQVHGPAELDYIALSEPLVNIEATVDALRRWELITEEEDAQIRQAARATFFKERSYDSVVAAASLSLPRRAVIAGLIERHRRDLKREEAGELVVRVAAASDRRVSPPSHWRFEETQIWRELLQGWRAEVGPQTATPGSISAAA